MLKAVISTALVSMFVLTNTAFAQEVSQTADLNIEGVTVTETTDDSISLEWTENPNAAQYVVQFGTEPVIEQGDTYNQPDQTSETNQITLSGLQPSTTYYISVIAFNEDGSSASLEFSTEVNATTLSAQASSLDIIDVETVNAGTVEVEFNDTVLLPENPAGEVSIRLLNSPSETLNVIDVLVKDTDNKVLVINTEAQSPDTNYVVEFSESFENLSGDRLSEVNRTQSFVGYNAANSDTTADAMTGLRVENIQALKINDLSVVEIDFNTEIDLEANDVSSFTIVKSNDPNQFLNITEIKPNNQDASKYLLVTEAQEETTYSLIMTALESRDGQTMSDENAIVEFTGIVEESDDSIINEPTDQTLLSNLRVTTGENSVEVLWDAPSSEENVSEVKVYLSTDKGENFNEVKSSINPLAERTTIENLSVGTDNQLRVTLVVDGNETEGQIIDFEIAETGPATSLALVLGFAGSVSYYQRRRNQFAHLNHFSE